MKSSYHFIKERAMSDITRISVAIPSEVSTIIAAAISGGQYSTTSEIVREALRDWSDKQALRSHKIEALRTELLKRMAEGVKDDGVDAFDFLDGLKKKYEAMEKERKE
jgi:antitoxin ParD1/3/4